MTLPGFNAESALGRSRRSFRGVYRYARHVRNSSGTPAVVLPGEFKVIDLSDTLPNDVEELDVKEEEDLDELGDSDVIDEVEEDEDEEPEESGRLV